MDHSDQRHLSDLHVSAKPGGGLQVSLVIPVWNGAAVIADCLESVYAHSGDDLLEIICVDNASDDESAGLIAERHPRVRLIRQPVNLGFSGGVNAGLEAAQGDVFLLLNQDCVVQPGWLGALLQVLETHPAFGIAGCTILNADGTVNHAGALVRRPDAHSLHLTEIGNGQPRRSDFVTGAAFAIRRQTWDAVGRFDEGFYPAYYEDADYCYRARRKGFETAYVPQARVTHLSSSHEWQADPVRHAAHQHLSRYRFVCKHFGGDEITDFFEAESVAVEAEEYLNEAIGRVIAARGTLRGLPDILQRRRSDLGDTLPRADRRQLQVGFTRVLRQSFAVAERLSEVGLVEPPLEKWEAANRRLQEALNATPLSDLPVSQEWEEATQQLQALQQREHELLERIYFRPPSAADRPEPVLKRWVRLLVLRPLSFLIGRDYLLLSQLNTLHVARLDQMARMDEIHRARLVQVIQSYNTRMEQMRRLYDDKTTQNEWLLRYHQERLERRLKLLETLTDYDYR